MTAPRPFTAFSFRVEIFVPARSDALCEAAFAECDGLEATMELKTIREGGNNWSQIRLSGPVTFGMLTLKRGMTSSFDLWTWMNSALSDPGYRARVVVSVLSPKPSREELARFELLRALPVKVKSPALNAKEGNVAIEELQIAYETLSFKTPTATNPTLLGGVS